MNPLLENKGKIFTCGCRSWRFVEDYDSSEESAEPTHLVHNCGKIIVKQTNQGLRRYFKRVS